jgi:hypothetical protein
VGNVGNVGNVGLTSEPLRAALTAALAGRPQALEDHFLRHGGGPDPRPNLKLAAAFGDEMVACEGPAARLLARFTAEDAAPDARPVFLPMAAAYGWVGRLRGGRDVELAWASLLELAGDERPPVRVATHAALRAFALVPDGAAALVAHALGWLDAEGPEVRWGAAALVVDVLADRQALAAVPTFDEALDYLSRVIADAAGAPRSAERSDGRRRLLTALPRTLATVVAVGGEAGMTWLETECANARQPNVRATLSDAVVRVQARGAVLGQRVRHALEGSAKPPRDPSRIRPGAGRGKASRSTR